MHYAGAVTIARRPTSLRRNHPQYTRAAPAARLYRTPRASGGPSVQVRSEYTGGDVVTIDTPHAPTIACEGCRQLFTDYREDDEPEAVRLEHHRGYDIIHATATRGLYWAQRIKRARAGRGQAIVEFALVFPIMMALLLATLEAGSLGARWIGYAHLADTITASAAATCELPAWLAAEADRSRCTDASAAILPGAPRHVELRCTYQGIAVNGLTWPVTVAEVIPTP